MTNQRRDPWLLDPDALAFHQLVTFFQEPGSLADALEGSPLFRVRRLERAARAEWIRSTPEDDPAYFPLGRVVIHPEGILLESFGERRQDDLRRRVNDLRSWKITADEHRIFRLPDAMERPSALVQPIEELEGRALGARDVAETVLRMAWPFFPRADLRNRAPYTVIRTGRGRAEIEAILPSVVPEMQARWAVFPDYDLDELRALLLPPSPPDGTGPDVAPRTEERPHPADRRSH